MASTKRGASYARYATNRDKYQITMGDACCKAPCCCLLGGCPFSFLCTQLHMRHKVLNHIAPGSNWDHYVCCQGYTGSCCCFHPGACCETDFPRTCMCVEACCCAGLAVSSTRFVVMDHYKLMADECDNKLIRFNNCLQILSCVYQRRTTGVIVCPNRAWNSPNIHPGRHLPRRRHLRPKAPGPRPDHRPPRGHRLLLHGRLHGRPGRLRTQVPGQPRVEPGPPGRPARRRHGLADRRGRARRPGDDGPLKPPPHEDVRPSGPRHHPAPPGDRRAHVVGGGRPPEKRGGQVAWGRTQP